LAPVRGGRWWGKVVGGWIQCQKMCTHACNCRNHTCCNYYTYQGRGG
jgi:hypothetical protein